MKAILDHVGIAVARPGRGAGVLSRCARPRGRGARGGRRRSACARTSCRSGESTLELLEATAPDSPIAKYLEKRGPGLHHITLRVDDIRAALAQLKARGVAAHRRAAAARRRRRARRVHPPVERARRAGRAEAGRARDPPVRLRVRDRQRYTLGDLELISLSRRLLPPRRRRRCSASCPKPLWEAKVAADDRNRIPLAMRPLVVRGVRTMLIDAGLGDKEDAKFQRDLRRRSGAAPRPRAGRGRAVARGHRHRARHAPALRSRRRVHRARRGGRAAAAVSRAPGTSSGAASGRMRRIRTSGTAPAICADNFVPLPRPACSSSSTTTRRSCRACGCGGPAATRCTIRWSSIESGGQTAAFVARPDADDGAPAGRRGSWGSISIRWTRWRRRRRSSQEAIERETLVFFEHDPAVAAGYLTRRGREAPARAGAR